MKNRYDDNGELVGKEITIKERDRMLKHDDFYNMYEIYYYKDEDGKYYLQELYGEYKTELIYSLKTPIILEEALKIPYFKRLYDIIEYEEKENERKKSCHKSLL